MANSTTISGSAIPTAAASEPELCRISGYLKNAHGQPLAGSSFVMSYCYAPLGLGTDTLLQQERMTVRADRDGYVEFDLIRGAELTLELPNLLPWVFQELYVPDAASVGLVDFLFPYVVSVSFSEPAAESIPVGSQVAAEVEGLLSNGKTVSMTSSSVTLESSNEAVLVRGVGFSFQGVSPGSADVTIVAVDRDALGLNEDKEKNPLFFRDLPAVTLPVSPKSVTVT